eukprot:878881-Pyramimonas_sp.AAC.1
MSETTRRSGERMHARPSSRPLPRRTNSLVGKSTVPRGHDASREAARGSDARWVHNSRSCYISG